MVPKSVTGLKSLVTSRQATCAGFLAQARAKGQKAAPYVREATQLWALLQKAKDVLDVIRIVPLKTLAAAIGFSDKARGYFSEHELSESIRTELDAIGKRCGAIFREEMLYRFLLTKGDALGGQMRNITGALAQMKFTSALVQALQNKGMALQRERRGDKITRVSWAGRLLLFDRKPKIVNKNIDVILLKNPGAPFTSRMCLEDRTLYLACGELKGGIDPAGADEHWKTARSALARIRQCFTTNCPKLFFAAAAIEDAMANEILDQLKNGELTYAANLTVDAQVEELAAWLASL